MRFKKIYITQMVYNLYNISYVPFGLYRFFLNLTKFCFWFLQSQMIYHNHILDEIGKFPMCIDLPLAVRWSEDDVFLHWIDTSRQSPLLQPCIKTRAEMRKNKVLFTLEEEALLNVRMRPIKKFVRKRNVDFVFLIFKIMFVEGTW